jgi:hypothetical protein
MHDARELETWTLEGLSFGICGNLHYGFVAGNGPASVDQSLATRTGPMWIGVVD